MERGGGIQTLEQLQHRQVARYGERPLFTFYGYGPGDDGRIELSFKTFDNWSNKVTGLLLEELGLEPGDVVAIASRRWQGVVAALSCLRAGVCLLPLSVALTVDAVTTLLRQHHSAVLIADEELAEQLAGGIPQVQVVAITDDLLGRCDRDLGDAMRFAAIVPGQADAVDAAETNETTPLILEPTGTLLRQGELLLGAVQGAAHLALSDADRLGCLGPWETAEALILAALAPLQTGSGAALLQNVSHDRLWRLIGEERVTVLLLSEPQLAGLRAELAQLNEPAAAPPHLRLIAVTNPIATDLAPLGGCPVIGLPTRSG